MSFIKKLEAASIQNRSLVCVGLDPQVTKIPKFLRAEKNPLFEFSRRIVDTTADRVCAYKPQIAYFAAHRAESDLELLIEYIHDRYPLVPVILDAKRSDMSTTAEQYAVEAFDRYRADALTVVPFQGTDALKPYLDRKEKGIILLCKTSNPGSSDLQDLLVEGEPVYQRIARLSSTQWNYNKNVSLVVGATQPKEMRAVRGMIPDEMPILVPGIGAQGGSIESSVCLGQNSKGLGLMISASRSVIYASGEEDFAQASRRVVEEMNTEIRRYQIVNNSE